MKRDLTTRLPAMLTGDNLIRAMTVLPEYNASICMKPPAQRLTALSDLYRMYLPSPMSLEIYSKLYLALLRSLQKKGTREAVRQKYENQKAVKQQASTGIIGGSDSFTIIGMSGIGKSAAIGRALNLITDNRIIRVEEPYVQIIPCIVVQCPFDSSVKGLLLEILRKVDEQLGSRYYQNALRIRATTDMLIGSVSQVALNHIGLLVVDEIQNVVSSKNGRSLVGMLTQLINNSGISICMVGTPESVEFFEQAMQLARRSLGLQYGRLAFDGYFHDFCRTLYRYQYTGKQTEITPAIVEWLYAHSAGVISVVVSLIHDAQEIAILNGTEELNQAALEEAYQKRLALLHSYIQPEINMKLPPVAKRKPIRSERKALRETVQIAALAKKAKEEQVDMVKLLRQYMAVDEVKI